MDTIFLHNMLLETWIGVASWERVKRQKLRVDLTLALPPNRQNSDSVEDTIDYAHLCHHLREHAADLHYQLLETLAEDLAEYIFKHYPSPWLRLKITKPGILPNVEVGVCIERSQTPS